MSLRDIAARTLPLLDLTTLGDTDSEADVRALCAKANSPYGHVAAVCVWPRFVATAKLVVNSNNVNIAAVANFPEGSTDIDRAVADTKEILAAGGTEVDLVFAYQSWKDNNRELAPWIISECKKICGSKAKLKVILETGELSTPDLIHSASIAAIRSGADFIKTSTGKTQVSATLAAAEVMLKAIKETGSQCGFKASGGIRDAKTAGEYLALADTIMGSNWVSPETFRFGASGLLDDLWNILGGGQGSENKSGY